MEKNKKIIVFTDFDGTISEKDVCYMLLEKYADFNWEDTDEKWIKNEISTEEAYRDLLGKLEISRAQFDCLIDEVRIDESFRTFYEFCRSENITLEIVSDGLDYYINRILEKYGIGGIKVSSNHLEFYGDKWIMKFSSSDSAFCPRGYKPCGFCKMGTLTKRKQEGMITVFIGDGASDRCPASTADYVFAKGYLAEYCREHNISYRDFSTFDDIIDMIKNMRLLKKWSLRTTCLRPPKADRQK